jgi:MFS family permease
MTETPQPSRNDTRQAGLLRQIGRPLRELIRSPQALWGVNISYLFDGIVYFGMLNLLGKYFEDYVKLNDAWTSPMVGFLTWGITFSMFFFGGRADRMGPRLALVSSVTLMGLGRLVLVLAVLYSLAPGLWGSLHLVALFGLFLIVLGNGVYQPACYAAIKDYSTSENAPMGYAMLYAMSNLGGWFPTFISPPVRRTKGVVGVFAVYAGLSIISAILSWFLLTKKAVERVKAGLRATSAGSASEMTGADKLSDTTARQREAKPRTVMDWLRSHPLADGRFSLFVFALIPVQTIFAHSWLTMPQYVERAYKGQWVADNFEAATNLNPLLIFILAPIIAAVTQQVDVQTMMVQGTFLMAAPTFLLCIGPRTWILFTCLVLRSIGEAMWQPRFLQYAAKLAPEGRTGAYMGVAHFPWFLTKMLTSLYAGVMLARYCPQEGPLETETLWLIHGVIAMVSTVVLVAAKPWLRSSATQEQTTSERP